MLTLGRELRIWKKWTERGEHGYPTEVLLLIFTFIQLSVNKLMRINDDPAQLTYPTLLEKWATCSVQPPNRWQNHIGTSRLKKIKYFKYFFPARLCKNLHCGFWKICLPYTSETVESGWMLLSG